ncbi:MAG: twin-arginine translocase TatA/TatE family subunit [Armatimonadetes bacterium]|nr:twin-arginine translocase TatA/TatE family subunit [Armatimonadota bacterium]
MIPIAWVPGTPEIVIIVLLIVLLFGIKKLPELGKSLAEGIREFKKASKKITEEDEPEVPAKKTE